MKHILHRGSAMRRENDIIEKALALIRKEFSPVDYVRFLSAISARRGDTAEELRDTLTEAELDKELKKRGARFL